MFYNIFIAYILFINAVSIIFCIVDKLCAIWSKRRVPEKTLMLLSIVGGSLGMYLTMVIIRHKTRHTKFMIGIPVIIMLQLAVLIIFSKFFY